MQIMKKRLVRATFISAIFAIIVMVGWFWAVPTYVMSKAISMANSKGVELGAESVKVSWKTAKFTKVEIRSSRFFPGQRVLLKSLTVRVSYSLDVEEVHIKGGSVSLSGNENELRRMWNEWRKTGKGDQKKRPKRKISAEEIRVSWSEPLRKNSSLETAGMFVNEKEIGAESVSMKVNESWAEVNDIRVDRDTWKVNIGAARVSAKTKNITPRLTTKSQLSDPIQKDGEKDTRSSLDLSVGVIDTDVDGVKFHVENLETEIAESGRTVNVKTSAKLLELAGKVSVRKMKAELGIRPSMGNVLMEGKMSAETLVTENGKITTGEIEAEELRAAGTASLSRETASINLTAHVGKIAVLINGQWEKEKTLAMEAKMKPTECQEILESVPKAVIPDIMPGTKMDGILAWTFQTEVDLPDRKKPSVRIKLNNDCKVLEVPEKMNVSLLRRPFNLEVYGPDRSRTTIKIGPGSDNWVPLSLVSRFVPLSFRTTEDPGFMSHRGFHVEAIENSMKMNITEGKFVRGASTISMQLAKNLWLVRSKTISRKIQEAVLTTYLEQRLSKEQILELYLNVVEFGPGLYGIGPAAKHYFASHPMQLSFAQSLFLASILPNPLKSGFVSGEKVGRSKMMWLHRVMKAMHDRQMVSEDEYAEGIKEILTFGEASTGAETPEPIESSVDGIGTNEWVGTE